ncbi:MAG TPA: hypothetical protein VJY62_05820, partial [Bacteroidia bacterium]|nr:hypothetical protein [Bacteroidia bacterium]
MNSQRKLSQKLMLRLRQKTSLRLIVAGGCIVVFSAILLIYFNLAMVKEMKARENSNNVQVERPVDMNVTQIKIDSAAANQKEVNYMPAKPLQQNTQ